MVVILSVIGSCIATGNCFVQVLGPLLFFGERLCWNCGIGGRIVICYQGDFIMFLLYIFL